MKRFAAFLLVLTASGSSWADRTINIAMPKDVLQLELSNPSTVAVSYSVKCFSASGSEITTLNSQSLAPNASTKHTVGEPDTGSCASGYTNYQIGTDRFGKKVYVCSGGSGVAYASAQTICGPGRRFCFPYPSSGCGFSFYGQNAWLKNDGTNQYYDNGNCSYTNLASNNVIYGTSNCTSYSMRKSSSESSPHYGLTFDQDPSQLRGATCCEDPNPAGVCKVTITGAAGAGFLASPQFKGGSPF